MDLNKREQEILYSIVDYHLLHGEAVGSRTLVRDYTMNCSAATVRNVMSDLELYGYIEKSHTSSGRTPTSKGYKYYIDTLLKREKLSRGELQELKKSCTDISSGAKLLSEMTKYTSFSLEPDMLKERLKKIELVYINEKSFLAVVVTSASVQTKRIVLTRKIDEEEIKNLSYYLNSLFRDQVLSDISITTESLPFKNEVALLQNFISQIESKVHLEGSESIINYLAKSGSLDAYKFLQAKEEMRSFLDKLVEKGLDSKKVNIVLGDELDSEKFKDLSFVFSTYERGDAKGMLGIVGPRRMEYGKVATILENISDRVRSKSEEEEK